MKNITVSVDEETYRRARVKAAELDTSVSALVRAYLQGLAAGESEFEQLARLERELRTRVGSFRARDRLDRDQLHERGGRGRDTR
jgi:plasmid stability protein